MLLQTESYRRGFAYSAFLSVLDNVLAFVPSMLIAAFFGTQRITDVYYYCTGLITLVVGFFNNIRIAVFIPEYMRLRVQSGNDEAMRFFNTVWTFEVSALAVLSLGIAVDPPRFLAFISKFPVSTLEQHRRILMWAIPLLPLHAMVSSLNDVLHSHKFFTLPVVSSITNRVLVILALLVGWRQLGIVSVFAGFLASFLVQLLLLGYLLSTRLRWCWKLGRGNVTWETLRNALFSALGGVASLGASYVPLMLFTALPAGEVTGLNIAQRLVGVPMAFLAGQAAAVMGIKMNEAFARQDFGTARSTFERVVVLLVLAMSTLSAFFSSLAPEVITVLYQRGAFDTRSTMLTASLFRVLVWSLPALGVNALVARIFMSGQRIREAFACQLVGNVCQIVLTAWAIRRWGGTGYPMAFVAFYVLYLTALVPIMSRLFPSLGYGRVLLRAAVIVLFSAAVAVCVWLGMYFWRVGTNAWMRILSAGPLVMLGTVGLTYLMPVCPELRALVNEVWLAIGDARRHMKRKGRL